MTTYKDYLSIRGFDVSKWNDNQETPYVPMFDKLAGRGFKFVGVRCSYGIVTDPDFKAFWQEGKDNGLVRVPYHYLDCWSQDALKITPAAWGKRQADYSWNLLKDDPGEKPLFLDVENAGGKYTITTENQSICGQIISAYLNEYDLLSGRQSGIYSNQGYMFVFGHSHRVRPLWLSWYNRGVTMSQISKVLSDWNWSGELQMLQYTSDGDVDDDGVSDAIALGMESSSLDLNVWVAPAEEFGTAVTTTASGDKTSTTSQMSVVVICPAGLKIRSGASQDYPRIGGLAADGVSHPVSETKPDLAGNLWAHIAEGWVCARFGTTWLAKIEN